MYIVVYVIACYSGEIKKSKFMTKEGAVLTTLPFLNRVFIHVQTFKSQDQLQGRSRPFGSTR